MLTLATFFLPPNAMEKILIGVIDLLILSFYLIYFSIIIPPLGDHMPFIGISKIIIKYYVTIDYIDVFFYYQCFSTVTRSSWWRFPLFSL